MTKELTTVVKFILEHIEFDQSDHHITYNNRTVPLITLYKSLARLDRVEKITKYEKQIKILETKINTIDNNKNKRLKEL